MNGNKTNIYGAGATTHLVAREAARVAAQSRFIPGTVLGDPNFSLAFTTRDPRFPSVVRYPTNPNAALLVASVRGAGLTTGVNTVYVPSGPDQRATLPAAIPNAPRR